MTSHVMPAGKKLVRTAIIAGRGALPATVAATLRQRGETPLVVVLEGEVRPRFADFDSHELGIGDFAGLSRLLARSGITDVVMAGGIERRPAIRELRPTLRSLGLLPALLRSLFRGDDAALKKAICLFEAQGLRVRGVQEIVPDLLPRAGLLTAVRPDRAARRDIEAARKAALALGALDIGQGCVAVGGRVVALEGAEGTDRMLERIAFLRRSGRVQPSGGVLVKMAKPQQDMRVDLPTMGMTTVEKAREAGLAGIAVEAGRSLLIDRDAVIAGADAAGIFVLGLEPAAP